MGRQKNTVVTRGCAALMLAGVFSLALAGCGESQAPDCGGLKVDGPWVREAPSGADVMGAYFKLVNDGDSKVVVNGVTSSQFDRAEIHETVVNDDGQASMQPMEQVAVPAGETVEFRSGGRHVMLFSPSQAYAAGDQVELILACGEQGAELPVAATVRAERLRLEGEFAAAREKWQSENELDEIVTEDDIAGVAVALGGKTKEVGKTMLTDGTRNIVEAMKEKQVKRCAVVTSIGTGDSEKQAPFFFKALMYTVMSSIFEDKNNQEKLFLSPEGVGKDLEYCIIRPGGLGVGPATGVINVIDGQAGSIQRADVASFCLGAINDVNFPYIRKTPCISSIGGTGWVKEKKAGFDAATTA